MGLITSPNVVKTVMFIRPKNKNCRLTLVLFFLLLLIYYIQHLLEKCKNIFQNPSKGLRLIRSFWHQIPFDRTCSLQILHVTRTIPPKLWNINEHKFASQLTYINQVNKLTMLFAGVLNSRSNFVQLREHDTNHIIQQMAKDTTSTSQIGQSSRYIKSDPAKPQESINRRRTKYKPEYQKFFLLVFPQEKLCT